MLESRLQKMKDVYHEYPRIFWILTVITFVDRIGGALIFPFFALYLTSKFLHTTFSALGYARKVSDPAATYRTVSWLRYPGAAQAEK